MATMTTWSASHWNDFQIAQKSISYNYIVLTIIVAQALVRNLTPTHNQTAPGKLVSSLALFSLTV